MTINPTAVWRVRPSGNNLNGGGFDSAISGAGTDYSKQDAAQVSGTAGVCAGTTNFQDTVATFTSAMVGNALCVTGAGGAMNFGIYFVVAFVDAHNVTLDRSPGNGVSAAWNLGGGWADFWTNTTSTLAIIKPGNIVYILGSGMPNPLSYVYDYSPPSFFTPPDGDQTSGGRICFIGDPATPSSGYPCIKSYGLLFYNSVYMFFQKLWLVGTGGGFAYGHICCINVVVIDCISDQFGYDVGGIGAFNSGATNYINCEVTSSVAARGSNSGAGIGVGTYGSIMYGCNVHDCIGDGVTAFNAAHISFNVIAKNGGRGIYVNTAGHQPVTISNNTIDNNLGDGIYIPDQLNIGNLLMFNNIISNHTAVGKYGINVAAGTVAQNDRVKILIDFNTFYNNTTNINGVSAGANDTASVTNPFNNESANDFSLVSAFYNAGVMPNAVLQQRITGWNG